MTTDTVGGVLGYSLDLCRAVAREGGEVLLVRLGPKGTGALEDAVSRLDGVTLMSADYKLEWMDAAGDDVRRSGELLLRLEREFRPHLVHLNGYALGSLAFAAPVLVVAHSCVLSWWQAVHGGPAPASYDTYRAQVQAGLLGADLVVAPSRFMRSALGHHYAGEFHSRVIPNGARAPRRAPCPARSGACSAGRLWDQAKNLALLLRAASDSGWDFFIAGETEPPAATGSARHEREAVPKNVHLLGPVPRGELAEVMANSALYVHPARYEPFGLSVLEAALAGCALVLADIPSLRELWQGAAAFFPADDAGALRTTLRRLREQPRERLALAERANLRAQRYDLASFERRYLALYAQLAQRGRPPAHRLRRRSVFKPVHFEARSAPG
jgi:glycosyltransferase involved in cell wall biosynthesis